MSESDLSFEEVFQQCCDELINRLAYNHSFLNKLNLLRSSLFVEDKQALVTFPYKESATYSDHQRYEYPAELTYNLIYDASCLEQGVEMYIVTCHADVHRFVDDRTSQVKTLDGAEEWRESYFFVIYDSERITDLTIPYRPFFSQYAAIDYEVMAGSEVYYYLEQGGFFEGPYFQTQQDKVLCSVVRKDENILSNLNGVPDKIVFDYKNIPAIKSQITEGKSILQNKLHGFTISQELKLPGISSLQSQSLRESVADKPNIPCSRSSMDCFVFIPRKLQIK